MKAVNNNKTLKGFSAKAIIFFETQKLQTQFAFLICDVKLMIDCEKIKKCAAQAQHTNKNSGSFNCKFYVKLMFAYLFCPFSQSSTAKQPFSQPKNDCSRLSWRTEQSKCQTGVDLLNRQLDGAHTHTPTYSFMRVFVYLSRSRRANTEPKFYEEVSHPRNMPLRLQ